MKALVLVDLQNDFLPGGALAVPQGDQVIPIANRVQPAFELVVATQDWHPAGHGSFAASHPGRKVGDIVSLGGLSQVLWPTHCVQHTPGAALGAALDTRQIAHICPKGTDPKIDSYSGFFDNGHKKATGLADYLRARGVTEIYLMGLATDYCVRATALDARQLGFVTHLIADGCRGVDLRPGDSERAVAEMRAAGVDITSSATLTNPALSTPDGMRKFRKRRVEIEAMEWTGPGAHPAVTHPVPIQVPIIENGREIAQTAEERAVLQVGAIQTPEGWMLVRPGDYVIRGIAGEFYACKPDIFAKTYEPADPK